MGRVDIWVGGRKWLEMAYFEFGGGFRKVELVGSVAKNDFKAILEGGRNG